MEKLEMNGLHASPGASGVPAGVKEEQQLWSSGLDQDESKHPHVKQEEEEEDVSQLPFNVVVKSEDEAQSSQMASQTSHSTRRKADGDDGGGTEPSKNLVSDLQPEHQRSLSSDSHTDDCEDWKDARSTNSGSNSEKSDGKKASSWSVLPDGSYILAPVGVCVGEGGGYQTVLAMTMLDTRHSGLAPNSVRSLLQYPFERRSLVEKLEVKELGPEQSDIKINQQASERGKLYTRGFSKNWYSKKAWLAGCSHANALFCFPCLLFKTSGTDTAWTVTGVRDMKHLSERIKKHDGTRAHMVNTVKLALLGSASIATQLDERHRIGVKKHNEEVEKNRRTLSKIIDCMKFCGAFELALHGPRETESPDGPSVFRALVDLVSSLEAGLEDHLGTSSVFGGTSEAMQNELLDCMLTVLQNHVLEEVKHADYLAIQVEEAADVSVGCHLVLVLRYIDARHNVQERFFDFIPLHNPTAATAATALLERLSSILPVHQQSKLIAQAYDGAAVMQGAAGGVQLQVKQVYTGAHYIHCYAHQLTLIMQQVTSHIPRIGAFFSDLGGFADFFSRSFTRTSVLDQVVTERIPGAPATSWNFHNRGVCTVYEHKDELLRCFALIRDSRTFDPPTVREAGSLMRLLGDEDFTFSLSLFHKIMPHAETLFNQLQIRSVDSGHISRVICRFTESLEQIRDSIPSLCEEHSGSEQQLTKGRRTLGREERQQLASEVCESILSHVRERFGFTKHLISATLLQGDLFVQHSAQFPDAALETTMEAYSMLNKAKLKTELSLIYENVEFKACSGALPLFRFFMENHLQGTFSETVSLLRILITTPMTTAEADRCFPTSRRIKTFLRNATTRDRLRARAMLCMEKQLVRQIPDFNNRVIESFASQKDRREEFLYK
ncbi:zinc finger MYM-type protein 1-like isoform X1 [Synchiropus splendidus]|uniref:zinc finger MYM-type protein 1-like isoform X1 n=1 Tax=Synchiropus splendidus TaxID=270530 RepID=UPI00237D9D11|nr:zinc finger MYM-type protein 1-like isoform X1 [Synchiropus splendidus]